MRISGRSFLRNVAEQQVQNKKETRDGILWDIPSATQCRVKIQGSDTLVVCNYPQNTSSKPSWMKIGGAVRILHRGGSRGNIEVTGQGNSNPMNAVSIPTPIMPVDAVLSGCKVVQISTGAQMAIMVLTGQVRISGQVLAVPAIKMSVGSAYKMDMGGYMGTIAAVFAVPSVPQGYYRQDIIVINSSGAVQYIQGIQFSSVEIMPVTPANCLLLNNILVIGGVAAMSQANVGIHWDSPYLANIKAAFEQSGGACYSNWPLGTGYQVNFTAYDQYGNVFAGAWTESLTLLTGAATVQQLSAGRWFVGASSDSQFAALTYSINGTNISAQAGISIPV